MNDKEIIDLMKEKNLISIESYNYSKLSVLYLAIKEGYSVDYLIDPSLNYNQMLEILYGLRDGVDVTFYIDPNKSEELMRIIRLMLNEFGEDKLLPYKGLINISNYNFITEVLRTNYYDFLFIYSIEDYQLDHLIKGFELFKNGYSVNDFMAIDDPDGINLTALTIATYKREDLSFMFDDNLSSSQKNELLLTVNEGLSIKEINNDLLTSTEMRQLRICLANGMNISEMIEDHLSAQEIKERRLKFLSKEETEEVFDFNKLIEYSKCIPRTSQNIKI